jgi:hypothetical protein
MHGRAARSGAPILRGVASRKSWSGLSCRRSRIRLCRNDWHANQPMDASFAVTESDGVRILTPTPNARRSLRPREPQTDCIPTECLQADRWGDQKAFFALLNRRRNKACNPRGLRKTTPALRSIAEMRPGNIQKPEPADQGAKACLALRAKQQLHTPPRRSSERLEKHPSIYNSRRASNLRHERDCARRAGQIYSE